MSFYKVKKLKALSVIPSIEGLLWIVKGFGPVDLTLEIFRKFAVENVHPHVMPEFPLDLPHNCLDKDFEVVLIRYCSNVLESLLFCPEFRFESEKTNLIFDNLSYFLC